MNAFSGIRRILFLGLLLICLPVCAFAETYLVPVGKVVGLMAGSDTLTIAAFDETLGKCAREAGLQIGDALIEIDGTPVSDSEEIARLLSTGNQTHSLTVLRRGKRLCVSVKPQNGKLGIALRQGIAGIGTITWYDPEKGTFGALGHGISTPEGNLAPCVQGKVFQAFVESVRKGKPGSPGQLKGVAGEPLGSLTQNTPKGVFGEIQLSCSAAPIPVGNAQIGAAQILSTVSGCEPQTYSVEILKIYPSNRRDGRNLLIKVTDSALIKQTGGIVQGMSGSPILQDGKLIGAVTHVLVNDPTCGYGIFIENMLEAAG